MFSLASYFSSAGYREVVDEVRVENSLLPQSSKKPYQAYCETEAPSRNSTPDSLVPLPLKTRTLSQQDVGSISNNSVRSLNLKVVKSNRLPASRSEQQDIPLRSPKQTEASHNRQVYSDRTPSLQVTVSVNRYHNVPQSAKSRGSHLTAPTKVPGYDHAQLLERTKQTKHVRKETHQTVHRRLSLGKMDNGLVKPRPLPPLPIEEHAGSGAQEPTVRFSEESAEKDVQRTHEYHKEDILPPPRQLEQLDHISIIKVHEIPAPAYPKQPTESTADSALRRTIPKDAKFMYPFGQRPILRLDHPLPLPPDTSPFLPPRQHDKPHSAERRSTYRDRPLPPLPITVPHSGPRQPPWGSLDHLSLQRHTRHEAREREQACQFRRAMERSTWVRLGAEGSVDGEYGRKSEAMKREVEGYREQIVHVYPDMAFDGNAGKGGRSCCCAVM